MIQIFCGARVPGTHTVLDAMHADRKRIFVDMLKWDVPVIDRRYEIDQFDNERAIYLISADRDGTHRGSIRLLPTEGDHILGTVFPRLCDEDVPRSTEIYEISRGCLSPRLRAAERLAVRNALTTAAVDYALLNGIVAYTCIAASGWLSQILCLGWECRPLGLPRRIGRVMTGALRVEIGPDTPGLLRDAGNHVDVSLVAVDAVSRAAA